MDAVERAVHTLHVLSSALGRIGSRFFLCVTVRFSERIAARSLFTEYGEYVGAGVLTAAYIAERAETFIPNAAARMHSEGQVGCKTVFDVAPAYLHPESGEALRAKLL